MKAMLQACAKYVATALAIAAVVNIGQMALAAGTAKLNGENVRPSVATSAGANASINVGPDKSITGTLTTSGIVATAVHIHTGGANENGPTILSLTRTGDDTWTIPAGVVLNDANYARYNMGELYIDVHSFAHPGGEMRGQISP